MVARTIVKISTLKPNAPPVPAPPVPALPEEFGGAVPLVAGKPVYAVAPLAMGPGPTEAEAPCPTREPSPCCKKKGVNADVYQMDTFERTCPRISLKSFSIRLVGRERQVSGGGSVDGPDHTYRGNLAR